ncbi:hypothetical protein LSTR_LSTR004911 [Laodelphax striatellus]|uniref:Uncharacterized protein n=1 Tax=Laodelphax striatellus TaxID=195883 RepID=A0A482XN08_LAOST|nr:hypothetical protein LSTR_LSTR004911 [Laodelphax striatellus]
MLPGKIALSIFQRDRSANSIGGGPTSQWESVLRDQLIGAVQNRSVACIVTLSSPKDGSVLCCAAVPSRQSMDNRSKNNYTIAQDPLSH